MSEYDLKASDLERHYEERILKEMGENDSHLGLKIPEELKEDLKKITEIFNTNMSLLVKIAILEHITNMVKTGYGVKEEEKELESDEVERIMKELTEEKFHTIDHYLEITEKLE